MAAKQGPRGVLNAMPPGSPRSPLWQTYRFATATTSFLDELHERYGDIFVLRLAGNRPWVCLSSPADLRVMYAADPDVLQSGRAAGGVFAPLTGWNASLTLDGAEHQRRRRMLLPYFSASRVGAFAASTHRTACEAIAAWPRGRPFALHPCLQTISLDVIMRAILGVEPKTDRRLAGLIKRLGEIGMSSPFLFIPALQWDFGRFSPWGRIVHLAKSTRAALLHELGRRRAAETSSCDDTLSFLLRQRDTDGSGLDDEQICDELIALLIAGYETTHIAMCWVFERLLAYPDARELVRCELAGLRDIAEIGRLPYLDAVVRESLRTRPVSPICGGRLITAPFAVAGYRLPPGVILTNCSYLLHRREDVYFDADRFRPNRFLESPPAAHELTTFGGGNRQCIGNPLALLEIKVVVAAVLDVLDLKPCDAAVSAVGRGVHLVPRDGLRVVAVGRSAERSG
jgi:cytochrome P450 family 110